MIPSFPGDRRSLTLEGADVAVAKPELCTIYVCGAWVVLAAFQTEID